jgi:hypothetical protein
MLGGLDATWTEIMRAWIMAQRGPISVSDAYRHFARHPKAAGNHNVRAKVRQQLALVARRIEPGRFIAAA